MLLPLQDAPPPMRFKAYSPFPCVPLSHRGTRHRSLLTVAYLPLLLLLLLNSVLFNWFFLAQQVFAAPLAPTAQSGHLTFQQYANEGQQEKISPAALVRPTTGKPKTPSHAQSVTLPGAEPATMRPLTQVLSATQTSAKLLGAPASKPLDLLSSDGRFEVQIPAGAFDVQTARTSQDKVPVGALSLHISQVQGHAEGLFNTLGTYQIQVFDSQKAVLKKLVLRAPLTVIYHYQPWEMQALDLDPGQILLTWPGLLTTDTLAKTSTANDVVRFTNNPSAHTLTAQTTVIDLSASLSVGSEPNNQTPPTPLFASVQGNSGNVSYGYPLQVAPGSGGFAPQLQLVYSSGSPNARHSQVSPADDAGDGWSVSLGAITASQQLTPDGEDSETIYSISGVDHISDRMVPDPNNSGFYLTEHLSHLRIQQVNNSATGQICFHVWDTSGTYYEYGCNTNALQFYTTDSGRVNYAWDLDLEQSATQGPNTARNQITATYVRDMATVSSNTSVRDAQLEQVAYGTLASNGSTFTRAGTIDFHYHAPTAISGTDGLGQAWTVAYGTRYHCATTSPVSTTLRCDDPLARGSSPAPVTMSTLTLDSIETFVGTDSATSHLDDAYTLTYNQDTPFAACSDPETGDALYCAGEHTLASITPTAYLGGIATPQKPTILTYTSLLQNSYYDSSQENESGSPFSGHSSWKYLASYNDEQTGVGERIAYTTAWNNTHGTPAHDGDDRYEPFFCTWNTTCTGSFAHPNDKAWTVQVVTQMQNWGTDSSATQFSPATTNYDYNLTDVGGNCPSDGDTSDCVGYEWYPSDDANWLDYYDAEFRGFATVYITSPASDLTVANYASTEGMDTPATDAENYLTGTLKDEEIYQGSSTDGPLLQQTQHIYAGDDNGGSAGSCDEDNDSDEYAICENVLLYQSVTTYDGTGNGAWSEQDLSYDDYDLDDGLSVGKGHYHNVIEEDFNASNAPTTRELWTYHPTDQNTAGVQYYDVNKATLSALYDGNNHIWNCTATSYDEGVASGVPTPAAGWPTRVQTYSSATCGSGTTTPLTRTDTGYDAFGNPVVTVDGVGTSNASLYASAGCTPTTQPAIMSPTFGQTRYTSCTGYDSLNALATTQKNALGQTVTTVFDQTQQDQPISATDANNQTATASYSYDGSGNPILTTRQPLETASYTSQSTQVSSCTTSSVLPCLEEDTHNSLYSTAISRTYYDNEGRTVETRIPGPTPGDDTVVMTVYNDQNHSVWKSVAFQVATGAGWIDPHVATDISGNVPAGTATFLDALGRTIAVQDPNYGSTQEPGLHCSVTLAGTYTSCVNYHVGTASGTGDPNLYESVTAIDPNGHVTSSSQDALGNTRYTEAMGGVYGGTQTLQRLTTTQYNALNKPVSVTVTDEQPQTGQSVTSVTTTMTYDDLGRVLTTVDPDQGTITNVYDADSRVTAATQTSGSSSRTVGTNYDLLGRVGCLQTAAPTFNTTGACTAGNPLTVNTYDLTKLGTQGSTDFPVGHLTQSVAITSYADSSSATVTQQYQTDQRGHTTNTLMQLSLPTGWNLTTSLPASQLAAAYNDAGQVTTLSATAGTATYSFTNLYNATNGTLQGMSSGGSSTANLATLAYNEYAQVAGITLLNGNATQVASEQYSYDGDQRPTGLTTNWLPGSGSSGEIPGQTRTYDNASNVTGLSTFFVSMAGQSGSGGSEVQNFCYDEQSRLIWSGNSGTQPGTGNGTCGSGTLNSGLVGGGYTAPFLVTNLGQLWQGPVNGQGASEQYLYCNSAPHQLSGIYPLGTTCATKDSVTALYAARSDPWGNETSRTTANGVTATLTYDVLNRLTEYDAGSTSQEFYVYDASGSRVLKRSISGGSITLTAYSFGLQELSYTGNGTFSNQIDYYAIAGRTIGSTNGTTTTYDLTDAEGSVLTSLSSSAVLGEQLYGPYGNQRYTQGSMGTDKGYTGQFQDALSGLDYYNARYYDPAVGQFLSADNVQGNVQGMNPYAYVHGNPETATDPTGQRECILGDDGEQICSTTSSSGTSGGGGTAVTLAPQKSSSGSTSITLAPQKVPLTAVSQSLHTSCPTGYGGENCTATSGDCKGLNSDQCGQHRAQENAQSIAKQAARDFGTIAASLDWLVGFLNDSTSQLIADGFLAVADKVKNTAFAAVLIALESMDKVADLLAKGFTDEANSALSWFTTSNTDNAFMTMDSQVLAEQARALVGSGIAIVGGILLTLASDGFLGEVGGVLINEGLTNIGLLSTFNSIMLGSGALYLFREDSALGG